MNLLIIAVVIASFIFCQFSLHTVIAIDDGSLTSVTDVEIDSEGSSSIIEGGDAVDEPYEEDDKNWGPEQVAMAVTFTNKVPGEALDLIFVGAKNSQSIISRIPPGHTVSINTYSTHSFYAVIVSQAEENRRSPSAQMPSSRAYPYLLTMKQGILSYEFSRGPRNRVYRNRDTYLNPKVTLLPHPTHAMNCRFKCIAVQCEITSPGEEFSTIISQGQEVTKTAVVGKEFIGTLC